MNIVAMILAGDRGTRLGVLSQKRVKSAVPIAGKYRIIDFALSNCANSDISRIGIVTQYRPHSLNHHIGTGRPWDLDRTFSGGVTLLPPYQRKGSSPSWYRGTADAIYQNLDFVLDQEADTVLVLPGDHMYRMDYNPLLRFHQEHQASATICAIDVPLGKVSQFGVLVTDDRGCVVEFQEKPRSPHNTLASMGIYVFQTDVLVQRLAQDARSPGSSHDFGRDVLPRMSELGDRLHAYSFQGYWTDVGTVQIYWEANMDLLLPDPPLNLSTPHWSIRTRDEERSPVNIRRGAAVSSSLITDGCVIEGRVEHSVLSPGVRVGVDAVVRDSVVFSDCEIGPGAIVDRSILDKNVVVGQCAQIGLGEDGMLDGNNTDGLSAGITLIGKNSRLPAGLRVGRSCILFSDLTEDDFQTDVVGTGQYVGHQPSGITIKPALAAQGQQDGFHGMRNKRSDEIVKTYTTGRFGRATS
jgi:glucose-1-phosphate adenylyltransferase